MDLAADAGEPPAEEPPKVNPFVETAVEITSTFSIDVDTASYPIMRMDLENGHLPDPDSVRVEEYVNYFDFYYPQPTDDHPFSIHLDAAPSHFGEGYDLLRIGLQGVEISEEERKSANLVFLVDVSGSMNKPSKLGLVKVFLTTLVDHLRPDDTLGIVVYAGTDAVILEPTPVVEFAEILRHSEYSEGAQFDEVLAVATAAGGLETDERAEFLDLVEFAESLWP